MEKIARVWHPSNLPEPLFVGLAVNPSRLIPMLALPDLARDRAHVQISTLSDVAPQALFIDLESEPLERVAPGVDVLPRVVNQRPIDIEEQHGGGHQSSLESAVMARKAAAPREEPKSIKAKPQHKENPIHHFAEEVEEHLIEGAELATSTTSAETNVVLAALGAIEGPRVPKDKTEKKKDGGKRRNIRPKTR